MVTGTSPGHLPLLFSYRVYIGCVVLQGCLRSHCGISKSQMVNLIPTCIVSSKEKNYFRMILLNSEKQCIYMYKGRRAAAAAEEEEEDGGGGGGGGGLFGCNYD